jgi:DNA-binding CsgD family transcriptional regulator
VALLHWKPSFGPSVTRGHAKGILSKLEARTRAQAVARAEAIGML